MHIPFSAYYVGSDNKQTQNPGVNAKTYKCLQSLINPHDGIVLYTQLDDYCDKLAVDCQSSEVLST